MIFADVMDEIADALSTISDLRVMAYTPEQIPDNCAVVRWPEQVTFDATMGRGYDQVVLKVDVFINDMDSRSSRDRIARYLNGSGDYSVKQAVDGFEYTACDRVTVTSVTVTGFTFGDINMLGAEFTLNIIGKGATP